MSLTGELQDVSVLDLLQFIHLGGRTGTLRLLSGGAEGQLGFHRGRIVTALAPARRNIGDHLMERGFIEEQTLLRAVEAQQQEAPRPPLGQLLVRQGAITNSQLKDAIEGQIEEAVFQLVTWTWGSFEFVLDELHPVDDISMTPGDVLTHVGVNTQALLLEAMRVFDERNNEAPRTASLTSSIGAAAIPGVSKSRISESDKPALQVVSNDQALLDAIGAAALSGGKLCVDQVALRDAGYPLPGRRAPVVLLDLRNGHVPADSVLKLSRARPQAPLLVVSTDPTKAAQWYRDGAVAIVPDESEAIVCCAVRHLGAQGGHPDSPTTDLRAGIARLQRVFQDLRSGLMTATVALNLMEVVSESADRAVLFLVRDDGLVALGAFGRGPDGGSLADATRALKVPRGGEGALADALADGQFRTCGFSEAGLPPELVTRIGPPKSGESVIFPVLGGSRVILVVYADNGDMNRALEHVELIQLAASQVGLAFENERLRRLVESAAAEQNGGVDGNEENPVGR